MRCLVRFRVTALSLLALSAGLNLNTSFLSGASAADEETGVFTTTAAAPIDYQYQGEFTGTAGEEPGPYGAQVIALGDNRYQLVGYPGGLPGAGWERGGEKIELAGQLVGEEVVFPGDGFTVRLNKQGQLTATADGSQVGVLERIVRESPTLGKEPPANAVVLFDGSSAEHFHNGKIVQEMLLLADCESKEAFGDHSMHLEFRTPFKPLGRGQGRGNSGVYVQGRYEIQVLDSFGLSGEDNECGGIYQVAKPRVNMCLPPLQWQSYDIDFTAARYDSEGKKTKNARITVRHNGVVIHDNLELPSHTPGKNAEADSMGPVYLQGHGNPVVYRNIWVVKK